MSTLDFITEACQRVLKTGNPNMWRAVWFEEMTAADRIRFDGFLVWMDDPLKYQLGPAEKRFETRVIRMANLERKRLLNKGERE